MSGTKAGRWRPFLLPATLLTVAVALVVSQTTRPWAVLDMWRPWGEVGALAVVMTAIILTGGIDLSVGSIIALAGVTLGAVWQASGSMPLAAAVALGAGCAAGAVNGAFVVLGIAPLVATLATMAVYAGLAMAVAQGQRVAGLPADFAAIGQASWIIVPNQLALFALIWILGCVVVHHTRFGRYLFALGENPLAAQFAAVPVRAVQWWLYTINGAIAALVAIVYCARSGAVVPNAGAGIELQVIACVVLGGTRVTGGHGGLGRTLAGVAILSLLDIGLQFMSGEVRVPWTGLAWQFSANARLLLVGLLVIVVAVWNERATALRLVR
jgi:rhamnose transport system permease protein